jgi:hypothetical protein
MSCTAQNEFVSGDTGSKLRLTLKNNDATSSIMDLTGATVLLRWRNKTDTATVEATMVGFNGAAFDSTGRAEYTFTANQLYAPVMTFEVKITISGAVVRSLTLLDVRVREAML